jgi:AcrR family transcriptional regulator
VSGTTSDVRQDRDGTPRRDRRAERRAATREEILEAAWALARERGLADISLRELGDRVGMRAQSLYSYFPSKDAIYDAMFLAGNQELLRRMEALDRDAGTPEDRLRAGAHAFVRFAVEDPPRSALLFLRVLPGFEPSPEAYAPAVQVLEMARERLAAAGVTAPAQLDLWTAIQSGLINQQLANEPGGDRWIRLVDDAVDMYLAHARGARTGAA